MFEKRYAAISVRPFMSDGQANGQIELADTTFFKVKQRVVVTADTEPNLELEVKAVLSDTILVVGPQNSNIKQITNVSAYTVAKNAAILADEQVRPGITFDEIHRAVYDEEPTVAYRSVFVDRWGRYYDAGNPLHVQLSDGNVNIGTVNADLDVQLTDKESAPGEADYDIVRVGNGINELDIESDGSVRNRVTGATDGTQIGNVGDSLKVETKPNKVSTLNSTTTPLSEDAVFTGEWEDCSNYIAMSIMMKSDVGGAPDGLVIQWSTDGVNLDHHKDFTFTKYEHGQHITLAVITSYFRVVFTNGSAAQSVFRLQTLLFSTKAKNPSHAVKAQIHDSDAAEIIKAVITGKTITNGGLYRNVAVDNEGRLLMSGKSELISPLPSIELVERRVLAAGAVYASEYTVPSDSAIKEFTFGGRGAGEGMFGRYSPSEEEYVPGGNFESSGDVSLWTNTGNGDGSALTLDYSTDQAKEGTGSLKLGPASRSDQNHYPQITYTWSTPISLDVWRYVKASFYNFAPTGGAQTRTISIRLQDINGIVRVYSVSGLTNAAPFNTNQWIDIDGEIRMPTSEIGSGFDINNVVSLSLRMQDSGNKAYTAIYWDAAKFIGELEIIQKIYTNGNTISLNFDPVKIFSAGDIIYYAMRSNDTVAREYQITVAGVGIT